jgi:hypothetical protein
MEVASDAYADLLPSPEPGTKGDSLRFYIYAHPVGPARELAVAHRRDLVGILGRAHARANCRSTNNLLFPAAHCTLASFGASDEGALAAWRVIDDRLALIPQPQPAPELLCEPAAPGGQFVQVRSTLLAYVATCVAECAPQVGLTGVKENREDDLHLTLGCDYGPLSQAQSRALSGLCERTRAHFDALPSPTSWDVVLWRRAEFSGANTPLGATAGTWTAARCVRVDFR